jgi:hypothetical protein
MHVSSSASCTYICNINDKHSWILIRKNSKEIPRNIPFEIANDPRTIGIICLCNVRASHKQAMAPYAFFSYIDSINHRMHVSITVSMMLQANKQHVNTRLDV